MCDLPAALTPLAWLVGTWRGEGVGSYPTIDDFRYGQEVSFTCYGKPLLQYTSVSWALDDDRPLARECGFFRPTGEGIEVVLAQASGLVEVFLGQPDNLRLEVATDLIARTPSAKDVRAERRLYGLVEGELMYALDMAAVEQALQPHLSARLRPVGGQRS